MEALITACSFAGMCCVLLLAIPVYMKRMETKERLAYDPSIAECDLWLQEEIALLEAQPVPSMIVVREDA